MRGIQRGGVAATVKHFVANDSDTERFTVHARVGERALRELYLAPFESVVRHARPWAVMAAYNGVNGAHDDRIADAHRHPQRRMGLRRRGRLGLARCPDRSGRRGRPGPGDAFVLARNDDSLLPLDPRSLRRVAVLGPNAAAPRTLGGGSATVFPPYRVSPLDGLRAALEPGVIVDYSPGVRSHTRIPLAPPALLHLPGSNEPGVLVEFAAEDGTVLDTERRLGGSCTWRSLPVAAGSARLAVVRVTTSVRAVTSGAHVIGCSGHGRFRLTLAGDLAFDTFLSLPAGTDPTEAYIRPPQRSASFGLAAGESVRVVLEHDVGSPGGPTSFVLGGVSFQLNIEEPYRPDDEEITRAVQLVQAADAAVVVVGTTEETESEGFDRATLDLPGLEDQLVRRVAAASPQTVVVVNTAGTTSPPRS